MKTKVLQSKTSTASRPKRQERQPFFRKSKDRPQAKPQVRLGPAGDKYEKEADSMADRFALQQVVAPEEQQQLYQQVTPLVQREGEEEALQPQEEPGEEVQLQAEEEEETVQLQTEEAQAAPEIMESGAEEEEVVQAQREEAQPAPEEVQASKDQPQLQREEVQTSAEEEEAQTSPEDQIQAQPEEAQAQEEEEAVQMRAPTRKRPNYLAPHTADQLKMSKGQGQALDPNIQQKAEQFFGSDFSVVRIHTDARAQEMNKQLRARAFAHGRDIYFNAGQYQPDQPKGQQLLIHELTHTIQQGAVKAKAAAEPATTADEPASAPDSPTDRAADPAGTRDTTPSTTVSPTTDDPTGSPPTEGDPQVEPLPPPKAPAEQEEVAKVEAAALAGSSDQALQQFTKVSPSAMAATYPGLGQTLDQKVGSEQREIAKDVPELTARTSGTLKEGIIKPEALSSAGADSGSGTQENALDQQQIAPHEDKSPVPNNAQAEKYLEKGESKQEGGFLGWLRANIQRFMSQIRTTDPNVKTSAGDAPKVDLSGEANPERMKQKRQESQQAVQGQRDELTNQLKSHPGQQNIQPKAVNESRKPLVSTEQKEALTTPADQAMQDYVEAPLSAEVRSKTDELLTPKLDANMGEARQQTEAAAKQRDTDKKAAVDEAQQEVKNSNNKADAEQRDLVLANRKKVAEQQRQGMLDAEKEMKAFNTEADGKQLEARKAINTEIKDKESGAAKELDKGEAKAKAIKKEGEKQAAEKKKELKKAQKKKSWWDRVKSAVKKAVKVITDAIDKVFTWVREKVKQAIEFAKKAAIALINKARKFIKDKLDAFRNWAKSQVNKYLKDRFPGLAKRINGAIDTVVDVAKKGVDVVADAAIKTVEFIADKLGKALDKVLQVFQTGLKAAVQIAGAVLTGDIAGALRAAIQAACDIAGIKSQPIFDFIDRAKDQILNILRNPLKFFGNLVEAVGGGVRGFFKNIATHLKKGLIGWLTGSISEGGLTLPDKFDFKGIVSIALQVLGLTYANIKGMVVKRLPGAEKVFSGIEKGIAIVGRLIKEGPAALWEEVKKRVSNFKEMIFSGIRDFVMTTVVREGIFWLLGLLNPAGALVKALKLIIDFVFFLVDNFQRIIDFVKSVYNSLAAIASGALAKAKKAVEDSLSRILPIAISLLANLAGLRGIAKTVKKIIRKISKPVQKIIRTIVDKMVKLGRKLLKKGKKAAKKVKDKIVQWWKKAFSFTTKKGARHQLKFKGKGKKAKLNAHSKTFPIIPVSQLKTDLDRRGRHMSKEDRSTLVQEATKLENLLGEKETTSKSKTIAASLKSIGSVLKRSNLLDEEVEPTKVVWKLDKKRAGLVNVNPLTNQQGNTKGETADHDELPQWNFISNRLYRDDISANSQKPIKKVLVVAAHLLNGDLFGPATRWNLAIAPKVINDTMTGDEGRVKTKVRAGEKMRWYARATYNSNKDPNVSDYNNVPEGKVNAVLQFHVAKKIHLKVDRWDTQKGEFVNFHKKNYTANLPDPAVTLLMVSATQLLQAMRRKKEAQEEIIDGKTYVKVPSLADLAEYIRDTMLRSEKDAYRTINIQNLQPAYKALRQQGKVRTLQEGGLRHGTFLLKSES